MGEPCCLVKCTLLSMIALASGLSPLRQTLVIGRLGRWSDEAVLFF